MTATDQTTTGEAADVKTMSFVTKMIGHQRTMAAGLVVATKGMEQIATGYEALQLDVEQIRAEAFQAGREAAARDIRAVRDTRAADACCRATGDCGLGDCPSDSVADSAFADAATIAETGVSR